MERTIVQKALAGGLDKGFDARAQIQGLQAAQQRRQIILTLQEILTLYADWMKFSMLGRSSRGRPPSSGASASPDACPRVGMVIAFTRSQFSSISMPPASLQGEDKTQRKLRLQSTWFVGPQPLVAPPSGLPSIPQRRYAECHGAPPPHPAVTAHYSEHVGRSAKQTQGATNKKHLKLMVSPRRSDWMHR